MPASKTLKLHNNQPLDPASTTPTAEAHKPVEALLLRAPEAARLAGIGVATWWRLHAAAKVPTPVRLGGATLWRVAELQLWIEAGCPARKIWESIKAR